MLEQLSQLFEFLWGGPLFLCVIGIGFLFYSTPQIFPDY